MRATSPEMRSVLETRLMSPGTASPVPRPSTTRSEAVGSARKPSRSWLLVCWLRPTSNRGVLAAVNDSGDTYSTGSICGNILGALHGESGYLDAYGSKVLDARDLVETVADDFTREYDRPAGLVGGALPGRLKREQG